MRNNFIAPQLRTQILVRFYRKSAKFYLEVSTELEEIIIGLMLGDLFAEKIKSSAPEF
jgi:hypothetical protein